MKAREKKEEELRNYIKTYVNNNYFVKPEYFPLIEEVIFRRAVLYNFDIDRVNVDLKMGAKWLTTIKFASFKKDKKDFYGFYNKGKKRIIFNKKNMNKTGKDINNDGLNNFVKFAHEFTHALCKDENGMDILNKRIQRDLITGQTIETELNRYNNQPNGLMLELIVSKLSERIIGYGYNNDTSQISIDYDSKNTFSYSYTSEFLEMLETAYGLKEIDFLSYAALGRGSLAKILSEKTGLDLYSAYDELDQMEIQYSVIHNLLYNNHRNNLNNPHIYNDLGNNFIYYYSKCIDLMDKRIMATDVQNSDDAKRLYEQLKYEYNKLNILANKFVNKNFQHYDDFKSDASCDMQKKRKELALKIIKMEQIINNISHGKNSNELLQDFNQIRTKSSYIVYQNSQNKNINIDQFIVARETIAKNKETVFYFDNSKIANIAANVLIPKNRMKNKLKNIVDVITLKKLRDKIKIRIRRIKDNKPVALLNSPNDFAHQEFVYELKSSVLNNEENPSLKVDYGKNNTIKNVDDKFR